LTTKGTGGEGGIRTPGRSFGPYNGLANRRIQPLCHLSAANVLQHCILELHLVTVPPSVAAFCSGSEPIFETKTQLLHSTANGCHAFLPQTDTT
jgi:hypothetical protein